MPKPPQADPKEEALRAQGVLNTRPVADELFRDSDFFDPRDLVQVKYEMLRRVQQEGHPVSQTAASFGFSRPAFYKIQAEFEQAGIAGLLPRKRGPRGGHKLTGEVLEFVEEIRQSGETRTTADVVARIRERFGVRVHRRTIERALRRGGKKTP
jgi:transposase